MRGATQNLIRNKSDKKTYLMRREEEGFDAPGVLKNNFDIDKEQNQLTYNYCTIRKVEKYPKLQDFRGGSQIFRAKKGGI